MRFSVFIMHVTSKTCLCTTIRKFIVYLDMNLVLLKLCLMCGDLNLGKLESLLIFDFHLLVFILKCFTSSVQSSGSRCRNGFKLLW